MAQFDFSGSFEDDFDGINQPVWSEADWVAFIESSQRESRQFLNAYVRNKGKSDRLEASFGEMGWVTVQSLEDLSASEEEVLENLMSALDALSAEGFEENLPNAEPIAYYRQPVYLALEALFHYLNYLWEWFMDNINCALPVRMAWSYAKAAHSVQQEALRAIVAMDAEEFHLGALHCKQALKNLNALMDVVNQTSRIQNEKATAFAKEANGVLFDLRELLLRCVQISRGLA